MSLYPSAIPSAKRYFTIITLALLALAPCGRPAAAASTIHLINHQTVTGTIDETASDEQQLVVKTDAAVVKIPRSKIERIEEQSAAPAAAGVASQPDQAALKQAESALAGDPTNEALRKKVDELRKRIQSHALLNYGVFFEKLDVLMKAKRFEEAIAEAEGILSRISDPGARAQFKKLKAQAHIGLAHKFHEFVNYRQEEENYAKAMEDDPENPVAPLELADLMQTSPARKGDAIRLYQKGIELAQSHPGEIDGNLLLDYEYKLAELCLNEKQYVAAGDRFLRVMQRDNQFRHPQAEDMALQSYSRLTQAAMDDTTRSHVIASTRKILAARPSKQAGYLLLGRIYFDQQQWTEACDNLDRAMKIADPRTLPETIQDALFIWGIALRKLHRDQDAALALKRLIAERPQHYEGLCELAEVLVDNNSFTEAEQLYDRALSSDGVKQRAHLGKGLALQRQGKFEDARKAFKAVLDREEKNAPAQLAIARSYFAEKKYDEAITEAEKMLQFIRDSYRKEETEKPADPGATGTPNGAVQPFPGVPGMPAMPMQPFPGAAGPAEGATQPFPGAAGSAEDPLATVMPDAAPTTGTAAAAIATTGTAATATVTTGTAAAPAAADAATTPTAAAADVATTPTLAADTATTQAAVAAAVATTLTMAAIPMTTPTLAEIIPEPAEPGAKPLGGVNKEDEELLPLMKPEDRRLWAEANTLIGKAHTISKRTNQARDNFTVALKFEPDFAEAYEGMALSYAADQLDAQALENFQKAIELDPQNAEFHFSLANYWHKTRKPVEPAKALPYYQKYVQLGGRDTSVNDRIKECGGK